MPERLGSNCVTCFELVCGLTLVRTTRTVGGKSDGTITDADGFTVRRCDLTNAIGWQRGGGCVDGGTTARGGARIIALSKRVSVKIGNSEKKATDNYYYRDK